MPFDRDVTGETDSQGSMVFELSRKLFHKNVSRIFVKYNVLNVPS